MIRLAVRCEPAQAEVVLAELLTLAPGGVEESRSAESVEYAIYGAEGELPDLGDVRAAAGDALVEIRSTVVPDDWAERWQRFHRPITVGGRLHVRPPWCDPLGGSDLIDVVVDPGRGFGTGAHPTTRLCLELLLGAPLGALADWGTGSGVLAIAASKLGFDPVFAVDHDPAAVEDARRNAAANGVEIEIDRADARIETLPGAPVVLANLLTPLLLTLAARMRARELDVPTRLICSGLLEGHADDVAHAFEAVGLQERERRADGEWGALALAGPDATDPVVRLPP